jgi:hypothetical protein
MTNDHLKALVLGRPDDEPVDAPDLRLLWLLVGIGAVLVAVALATA